MSLPAVSARLNIFRMQLKMKRVILFVNDMERTLAFYRDVLGLALRSRDGDGWAELDAGACVIALHSGGPTSQGALKGPKIVFGTDDVGGVRDALLARGAPMGPLKKFGTLELCDTQDPDGTPLQLSNRP